MAKIKKANIGLMNLFEVTASKKLFSNGVSGSKGAKMNHKVSKNQSKLNKIGKNIPTQKNELMTSQRDGLKSQIIKKLNRLSE